MSKVENKAKGAGAWQIGPRSMYMNGNKEWCRAKGTRRAKAGKVHHQDTKAPRGTSWGQKCQGRQHAVPPKGWFHAQVVDFQSKHRKTSDYVALFRFRNVALSHMPGYALQFAGSEVFPHGRCAPREVIARFRAQVVDFPHPQVRNSECGVRNEPTR
jgi:hypothetical protein